MRRNKNNNTGLGFRATDIPAVANDLINSSTAKALENLLGRSKGLVDTRLPTNLARGALLPVDLLALALRYKERVDRGEDPREALAKTASEA